MDERNQYQQSCDDICFVSFKEVHTALLYPISWSARGLLRGLQVLPKALAMF